MNDALLHKKGGREKKRKKRKKKKPLLSCYDNPEIVIFNTK